MTPVIEILINSPKIAKHIELGETKEILEEIESSVGYYRMQSMNQSLIALLVNGRITYARAMELSADPEDLSLKLRKLFPQIEEDQRGGLMASDNDFSAITELMDVKTTLRGAGREVEAPPLREGRGDRQVRLGAARAAAGSQGRDQTPCRTSRTRSSRLKVENERIEKESQEKIGQLNERIKELNQRVMLAEGGVRGSGAPPPPGLLQEVTLQRAAQGGPEVGTEGARSATA